MTERPILFNSDMVNAILAGRKTQTRRIIKNVPSTHDYCGVVIEGSKDIEGKLHFSDTPMNCVHYNSVYVRNPYGHIGDELWVRETFRIIDDGREGDGVYYRADSECHGAIWKPSIFMPRWASRIQLKITDIRVERLQSISQSDAIKEGIPNGAYAVNPVRSFQKLWTSINGEQSWNNNPWVWVVEFEKVKP